MGYPGGKMDLFEREGRKVIMANMTSTPGFAQDIKPLFREDDRDAMEFIFDL
jgi:hypothetical protein